MDAFTYLGDGRAEAEDAFPDASTSNRPLHSLPLSFVHPSSTNPQVVAPDVRCYCHSSQSLSHLDGTNHTYVSTETRARQLADGTHWIDLPYGLSLPAVKHSELYLHELSIDSTLMPRGQLAFRLSEYETPDGRRIVPYLRHEGYNPSRQNPACLQGMFPAWRDDHGHFVVDCSGKPLRFSHYLPATVQTGIPDHVVELISLLDPKVKPKDILARMPESLGRHTRPVAQTLRVRRTRAQSDWCFVPCDSLEVMHSHEPIRQALNTFTTL